jgi:hypothetical protein
MSLLPATRVALHRKCSSDSLALGSTTIEKMTPVQRWDGHAREARDWNELRRVRARLPAILAYNS